MKRLLLFAVGSLLIAWPAAAQTDFLTADEVEKVREAQLPNDRLKLYVLFARQRIDELEKLLAKEKKGRSAVARELIEQYTQIIDAIDTVSDDALKRKVAISEGSTAANAAEKTFLTKLQKIQNTALPDLGLYEVALREAIASTTDSLDLAKEDLDARSQQLADEDAKEKEKSKSILSAEDSKGKPVDETAAKSDAPVAPDGTRRKPPTLMRPGEKVGDPSKP